MLMTTQGDPENRPYQAIGLVYDSALGLGATQRLEIVLESIEKAAKKMGADAVIGLHFQLAQVKDNQILTVALGTAIKYA